MAILFEARKNGSCYQVRSAGATRRLYSNGVLHSQWNPNQLISGAIWDLMILPGFLPKAAPKRILMLGLGGGTSVHLMRHFFPDAHITCIELDPLHIRIAQNWFDLPKQNVTVVKGDAYGFLNDSTEQFDWIFDDVFQHVSGEPSRESQAFALLDTYRHCLAKHGLLSFNMIGRTQFEQVQSLLPAFSCANHFRHPLYDNRIVSFGDHWVDKKAFVARLRQHKMLDKRYKTCRLRYHLRELKRS